MFAFLLLQAPAPVPQVQAQTLGITIGEPRPPKMEALLNAKDWAGLADWFETMPPAIHGKYYETWIQSLNRSQRWERLLVACEALQPQLEATSGPRLGTYRLYRAQALGHLGRHSEAARAHAENGRMGYPDGLANASAEAHLAKDWPSLLAFADEILAGNPGGPSQIEALSNRGLAHFEMKDYLKSRDAFQAALALRPGDPVLTLNLRQAERHILLPAPKNP